MFKIQLIFFKLFFLFFKKGYPFGIIKWSTKKDYFEIYEKIIQKKYINIDNYENKIGYKIDKNWIDNLALHTQVVIKKSQINYQHGRVLYSELRNYIAINKLEKIIILETGTARGFSSVCMSKAISDSSIQGDIHTVDILPNNKKFFWNSVSDFEGPKTRSEILKEWLNYTHRIKFHTGNSVKIIKNLNLDRINFAFLDGSHNKEKVRQEFNWVENRQLKNDIIIFDDYDPQNFRGIFEFVNNLEKQNTYKVSKIFSESSRGYAVAYKL